MLDDGTAEALDGGRATDTTPSVDTTAPSRPPVKTDGVSGVIDNMRDEFGNKIVKVFAAGANFVIFQIETNDVGDSLRVHIDDTSGASPLVAKFAAMNREFSDAVGLLYTSENPDLLRADIARSLAAAFVAPDIDGRDELRQIQTRASDQTYYKNGARFLYAYAAFTYLIFIASEYYFRVIAVGTTGSEQTLVTDVFDILFSTALGGCLSIVTGLSKIRFDVPMFATKLHRFAQMIFPIFVVFERIVVATVAGSIAYVLIKSNFLLQPITSGNRWSVMAILILAGFSESLIPSVLARIETNTDNKNASKG